MRNLTMLIALLSLTLVSCQKEWDVNDGRTVGNGLRLSYNIEKSSYPVTRTAIAPEQGEEQINSLYVLFFEYTTGGTGVFIEAVNAMEAASGPLPSIGHVEIDFSRTTLSKKGKYTMMVCANIDPYIRLNGFDDLASFCEGKTEDHVSRSLTQFVTGVVPGDGEQVDNTNRIESGYLPMSAKIIKEPNVDDVQVELTRTLARFDVFCEADGYTLYSASIWNAYTDGFVWTGNHTDFSAPRTERFYGVGVNQNDEIIGSLYAFENYVKTPEQSDKVTTCLIVGLYNETSGDIEYFRANINASGTIGQQLSRNHVYRTIIRNVRSEGSDNERGAYEESRLLLDIDINSWLIDDTGSIQFDGENVLAIPTKEIGLYSQGDNRVFFVHTLGDGVPELVEEYLPSHISINFAAPTNNSKFKTSFLTVNAAKGTTIEEEYYYVKVKFASMEATIRITQNDSYEDYLDLNHPTASELEFPFLRSVYPEDIKVTSSDEWIAKIYQSDFMSFEERQSVTEISGTPGGSFPIYTIKDNTVPEDRYCFMLVSLKKNEDISRVLVLKQSGMGVLGEKYLLISPETIGDFPAAGGTTGQVTVYSSGAWTAEVTRVENTLAGFMPWPKPALNQMTETYNGGNGTSFIFTHMSLKDDLFKPGYAEYTFKLVDDPSVKEVVRINQRAATANTPIVHVTMSNLLTALYDPELSYSYNYVYEMNKFMRDTLVVTHNGHTSVIEPFVFISKGPKNTADPTRYDPHPTTNLTQILDTPGTVNSPKLISWLESDKKHMLFFCNYQQDYPTYGHNLVGAQLNSISRWIPNTNSTAGIERLDTAPGAARTFASASAAPRDNALIAYLLDGPFGKVNPDNVKLFSNGTRNAGVDHTYKTFKNTFIPIIMAKKGSKEYCVLGIDVYYRYILMSDPGLMGSRPGSGFPNEWNFTDDKVDNVIFFKNLMSWIMLATTQDGFLEQFGTIKLKQ